jgi:predicted nucleic acid-binding protein
MKQYLLDINVILDLLLNRAPWAADAAVIWDAHRQGRIRTLIAAFSLPTIYYIVRRQAGLPAAQAALHACLSTLDIVPVDLATLLDAQARAGTDFEDDLQISCAVQAGVDAIVARDPRGFAASPVTVLTPADLATSLSGPAPP